MTGEAKKATSQYSGLQAGDQEMELKTCPHSANAGRLLGDYFIQVYLRPLIIVILQIPVIEWLAGIVPEQHRGGRYGIAAQESRKV